MGSFVRIFHVCVLISVQITLAACGITTSVEETIYGRGAEVTPLVIPPSEYFEGIDGPWSTFNIRAGTPEQNVRVTISTASSETLVVLSQYGCTTEALPNVPADCANSRGMLFNPTSSSSWIDKGDFYINGNGVGFEENLGYVQRADFGLETLGLGLVAGGGMPTLKNQTVAGIATAQPFYLGTFGLGTQPVNFTTLGNISARVQNESYFQALKTQDLIPSLSWSYTAGAKYELKEVYGQLIFGGYDTSRFKTQSTTFTLAGDISRDIVVAIQSISFSGKTQATLLTEPIQAFMDFTDPNLWLPDIVCDQFEAAFNLIMDNTTGLYLISDTQHSSLLETNAMVTFTLSDAEGGGSTVDIALPYEAFALKAEYPLVQNTSYYFPLKRAANSTQFTLGRTFFQEAYLTVDYERGNFSVSPCAWNEGAASNIVTITSPNHATSNSTSPSKPTISSKSSLSGGAIVGIILGVFALIAIIGGIAYYVWYHKRQIKPAASNQDSFRDIAPLSFPSPWKAELDSTTGSNNSSRVWLSETIWKPQARCTNDYQK